MGTWLQELLKLMAGAAIGITVYNIIADDVNIAGGQSAEATQNAGEAMQPGK